MASGVPLLRGVIIDWAGVLTIPLRGTVSAWAEAEGIDWDSYTACMRSWLDDAYLPAAAGNPVHALERGECAVEDFEETLAGRLVRLDGGRVPARGLLRRMFAASVTVPAMYDVLRTLRAAGIRTCLLSNSWGPGGYPREDFPELFDAVVISHEVGMRKPEHRIFRHAAGLIALPPADCVFIDDIEANVTAATECGMTGIWHTEPEVTAARLSGLLGIPLPAAHAPGGGSTLGRHGGPPGGSQPPCGPEPAGSAQPSQGPQLPRALQRRPVGEHARDPAHRHQAGNGAAPGAAPDGLPLPQGLPA